MSVLLSCLNPTQGYRVRGINPDTGKKYGLLSADGLKKCLPQSVESVAFRCGKCINCLKYRGSVILARCVAESRMHDDSAFVTLTVSDDCLDKVFPNGSLIHRPFQLFCKRLRKRVGADVKYIMCGEYGELSQRPHYHAIFFGLEPYKFTDTGVMRQDGLGFLKSRDDNPVFSESWPFGEVYCGSVTPASIAYVSGYTLKQYTLGRDDAWYKSRKLAPEYVKWSRRPGLGRSYFDTFGLLEHHGSRIDCGVPVNDRRVFPGRYYLDWLRLTSPENYDMLLSSYEQKSDITPDMFRDLVADRSRKVDFLRYQTAASKRR